MSKTRKYIAMIAGAIAAGIIYGILMHIKA